MWHAAGMGWTQADIRSGWIAASSGDPVKGKWLWNYSAATFASGYQ